MNENTESSAGSVAMNIKYGVEIPDAVKGRTIMTRFDSNNGVVFDQRQPGNEIRIPISSEGFFNGSSAILQFSIENTDTTNCLKLMNPGANSIFDEVRIEANGKILEVIDGYNQLCAIQNNYKSEEEGINFASFEGGSLITDATNSPDDLTDPSIIKPSESRTYTVRLRSGFVSGGYLKKSIPLLNTGGFEIILRLASVEESYVVVNQAGILGSTTVESTPISAAQQITAAVNIHKPRVYAQMFTVDDPSFMNRYQTMLSNFGIQWDGITSRRYVGYIASGTGPSIINLGDRSLSLYGLVSAIRRKAEINSETTALWNVNCFATENTNVDSYVFRISGKEYPLGKIQYGDDKPGQAYFENLKLFTDLKDPASIVDISQFTATSVEATSTSYKTADPRGTLAVCLKKYDVDGKQSMTGLNTSLSTMPSTVEIKMDGANALNYRVDTFAICGAVYSLSADGSFDSAY